MLVRDEAGQTGRCFSGGFRWQLKRRRWIGRAAHLAIAWLLANWWIHDSLHVHFEGGTVGALLGIEYGFHFTLMIAGGILAAFFAKVVDRHA